MPPILFPLPTTAQINFSNLFIDPTGSFTTTLAEASSARTQLYLSLKAIAEEQPGASALAVVDGYLPYIRGVVECLDNDTLLYRGEPVFGWKAPLTHYSLSPPLLPMPSIHSEHLMVLLTYTLALSNYAHSILGSLPSYEPTPGASTSKMHVSKDDEARIATGLARSVDLLCQASGVAQWTAENICPKLDGVKKAVGRLGKSKWPIEGNEDAYRGLSMMLLADAHITAIRKLLLPILSHSLFSPPGPPLPSNHPSPSLLAKLYLHVSTLYDSSRAVFKVNSADTGSKKLFSKDKDGLDDAIEGDATPELKRYLRKESILAAGLARKWLGVDAGENGKGAKVGEALSWVKDSQIRLQELEDGAVREKMKGLSFGKSGDKKKEERKARKGRLERELDDIGAWVRSYQQMNDTVSFQPIPPVASLTTPSGRPIFAAKAFVPPASKFPLVIRDPDGDEVVVTPVETREDGAYAGKGNYF